MAARARGLGVLLCGEYVRAPEGALERNGNAGIRRGTLGFSLYAWLDQRTGWFRRRPVVFLHCAHLLGRRSQTGIPRRPVPGHNVRRLGIAAFGNDFSRKTRAAGWA